MPSTTLTRPGRAGARGGAAHRIGEDARPVSSQHHFRHPRPALTHPPLPISHPIPSPSSSRPVSHSPSSLLSGQTPLHRGCAGWAPPVEVIVG